MRDLTRSVMSCTWAMSVFGVQQIVNLFIPRDEKSMCNSAQAVDQVTEAAAGQLSDTMKAAFRAGDQFQRGVVDVMFGAMMMGAWSPERWMRGCGGGNGGPPPGASPPGPPPGSYPSTAGSSPGNEKSAATGPQGPASWSWGPPRGGPQQSVGPRPAAPRASQNPSKPGPLPAVDAGQALGWGPMP